MNRVPKSREILMLDLKKISRLWGQKAPSRVPTKPWKWNSMTSPWLSTTKLAIFHDKFSSQDSPNSSSKIYYWTISDTTMSVTKFRMQIRVKLTIFQDHFRSWNFVNFSREIHEWTILETTIPWTIFWMWIRVIFLLSHDFSYFCHFPWFSMTTNFSLTFHDCGNPVHRSHCSGRQSTITRCGIRHSIVLVSFWRQMNIKISWDTRLVNYTNCRDKRSTGEK